MDLSSAFDSNKSSDTETASEALLLTKPGLGKFLDVYSHEHLNLTPKVKQNNKLNADKNEDDPLYHTPERFHKTDYACSTIKPQRNRIHNEVENYSFEANQSFPRVKKRFRPLKMELETPSKSKPIDIVRVDGPNGLRFNTSLATSEVGGSPALSQSILQQAISTSKAVFTVEPATFKILIVNNKACSMLGYASSELCGLRFEDLLHNRSTASVSLQAPDGEGSEDGTVVLLSGKVVELSTKGGGTLQVSLWIRQLDNEGPCLIVAEPVSCRNVVFLIESDSGSILSVDSEQAALIFGTEGSHKLVGLPISTLIPNIALPAHDAPDMASLAKQKLTGRTLDGGSFPICLWICKPDADQWSSTKHKHLLEIHIRVTFNVSGLLVVDESSRISACNPHFAKLTFGKGHSDVIGHHIDEVIPNFCRDADLVKAAGGNREMTLSPVHNDGRESGSDTDEDSCGAFNGSQKSACTSFNVQPSILSHTQDKSSSALCLDKSTVTHTPTPTQDMVSSISTTEQRNDLPDVTSGISCISIEDDACYQSSISKSRSENILRSEQSSHSLRLNTKPGEVDLSQSDEVTPTGNNKRLVDPSVRLSLDSSKYKSMKGSAKDDKTSLSLDFCDSNETSADFLTPINEMPASGCDLVEMQKRNGTESTESLSNDIDLETQTESAPRKLYEDDAPSTPKFAKRLLRTNNLSTSTPQALRTRKNLCDCSTDCQHKDGTYKGVVLHKDGTEMNVVYTVSSMVLSRGRRVLCVWLAVQSEAHAVLPSCSLASTADNSQILGNKSTNSRPQSMSLLSQCGEEQTAGEYSKHYVTLKQIGKGAYGCVKKAYRRSDRLLCVAKFIVKEKVSEQFWVEGPEGRMMPLELSLLLTLNHPNIVSVMDVYENEKYYQMVMERHGAGMDLFEFIERRPRLDEPLVSYIFRQIGQAIEYLHSLNILHRDIKDENVIIDNKFQIKLIDFGSATFMSKDTLFSTFYGTTEYCSPEVLAGNKYAGPELEMWSMGITLYVLVFFVNPFSDIEDTIQGPLALPQPVTEDLEALLRWMLCKDPAQRCTVGQLMAHPWIRQTVPINTYAFHDVVQCDRHEANPETYYSGSLSPKSGSQVSLAEAQAKASDRSNQSEVAVAVRSERVRKRNSVVPAPDQHSDNYSLRSSADILDISSKPVSDALTDSRSDATGHAACDIDCDCELYDDSWDECEQDSFS